MINTINSTDVRRDWSNVIDSVIRVRPAFIKRTRDELFLTNIDVLLSLLEAYEFIAAKYVEEDGSVTLSLDAIDLVENAKTESEAILRLSISILEYANDYYHDFSYWSRGNRASHIPYVLKAIILRDPQKIGESIVCRHGEI